MLLPPKLSYSKQTSFIKIYDHYKMKIYLKTGSANFINILLPPMAVGGIQ
jgi:hypothetical protein